MDFKFLFDLWKELKKELSRQWALEIVAIVGTGALLFHATPSTNWKLQTLVLAGFGVLSGAYLRIAHRELLPPVRRRMSVVLMGASSLWALAFCAFVWGFQLEIWILTHRAERLAAHFEPDEAIAALNEASDLATEAHSESATAVVMCALGKVEYHSARKAIAEGHLHRCLSLATILNDLPLEATASLQLGRLYYVRGDTRAVHYLSSARSLFHELQDLRGEAEALGSICDQNLQSQARPTECDRAIALATEAHDTLTVADAYRTMGSYYSRSGDLDKSATYYELALGLYGEDDGLDRAFCQLFFGEIESQRGNFALAIVWLGKAKEFFHLSGNKLGTAQVLATFGDIYKYQGKYVYANKSYNEALALYDSEEDFDDHADVFRGMAELELITGSLESGEQYIAAARKLYEKSDNVAGDAYCDLLDADLHRQRAEVMLARTDIESAQRAFDSVGDVMGTAQAAREQGLLQTLLGRPLDAIHCLEDAHTRFADARDYDAVGTAADLAFAYRQYGQKDEARQLYAETLDKAQSAQDILMQAISLHGLADLDAEDGHIPEAADRYASARMLFSALNAPLRRAEVEVCFAFNEVRAGRSTRAFAALAEAETDFGRSSWTIGRTDADVIRALLLARRGLVSEASRLFAGALQVYRAHDLTVRVEQAEWIRSLPTLAEVDPRFGPF
jgi:tetratricopeptide (TPR) repeat protein